MSEGECGSPRYTVRRLSETEGTPCPCGTAYRVLGPQDGQPLSVHYVDIGEDARPHYHTRLTETYVVLEGEGTLELDTTHPQRRGAAVRPGGRARGVRRPRPSGASPE